MSGADSDAALVESVQNAGNVILLAEASYGFSGDTTSLPPVPDQGFAVDDAAVLQRQAVFLPYPDLARAAAGFGHSLLMFDPGRSDSTHRAVREERSHRRAVARPGGGAAGPRAIPPGAGAPFEARPWRLPTARMPLATVRMATEDGSVPYLWGLIDFRGPALLDDLKSRPYPSYSFFDLLLLRRPDSGARDPEGGSVRLPRQDRVRRRDGGRSGRRVRNAVLTRQDAGHSDPCRGCRRCPVGTVSGARADDARGS